jgi:hypothetical protein
MKPPSGARLDDALDMLHNDSWAGVNKPELYAEQVARLLVIWELWFRDEFAPKPRADRPKQKVQSRATPKVDKGSQSQGRTLVYGRSGRLCEVQTEVCTGFGQEWQHRKNRSQQGTWHASNGLDACSPCHAWIHANPHAALQNGWTVPSFADPAERPVLRRGVWVLLDNEGSFEPVEKRVA